MQEAYHSDSLDSICAALCYAMGIEAPASAAPANRELCAYLDRAFQGEKADRVVMYNPDAIANWLYRKYPQLFSAVSSYADIELPLRSVMPSVTPVCFGTMYTGAQPSVHGIQKYEKPVIRIDTLFDALIRAGKKPVIVADSECSLGRIFQERDMDYYLFDTLPEVNAKTAELLLEDRYDFMVIYNGNYDALMHRFGPESTEALAELRANTEAFSVFAELIRTHWHKHNALLGFAMDHGCHEIDAHCGSHGLDMVEDLNITHLYQAFPKQS